MRKLSDEEKAELQAKMERARKERVGRIAEQSKLEAKISEKVQEASVYITDKTLDNQDLQQVDKSQVEYEKAGFWIRFGAAFVDLISFAVISGGFEGVIERIGVVRTQIYVILFDCIFLVLYPTLCIGGDGQTFGKKAFGLRVLRTDFSRVSYGRAFLRWIGYLCSTLTLGFGFLMIGWTKDKQGLHDRLAETFVLVERAAESKVDAVCTSVEYAGFGRRFAAFLIDGIIIIAASFLFSSLLFIGPTGLRVLMAFIISLAWLGLYHILMESSSRQATVGKMAVGIVVTDLDGNKISLSRAAGRNFGKMLGGIFFFIGFIMVGFTEKKQALHDILAHCLVVMKKQ